MVQELFYGTLASLFFLGITYSLIGWRKIYNSYKTWFDKEYWTDYNIVEALSWFIKAIIIVPGLIFGIQLWWIYVFALITSIALIWASEKKLLPTLVSFNSLWVWISCMAITIHFIG